ncbi:unnamed protein product [Periconia digitata]|uniref:Galactose oxidase n=1 Tax=Periconia digitata TaxID=1303443 RepID=A0A9W4UKF5_9PLEO|nr:unnamed protein product [Periconia digitata]
MAELAAGAGIALAAEQVVSTTAQVGTAGYILTKPTQPLKATFTRIATADDDDLDRRSLTRSHHTLTILNNKAHIFGGTTSDGKVATNDIHIINLSPQKNPHSPEYQLIPAIDPYPSSSVFTPRTHHAACAYDRHIAIYGGTSPSGSPISEDSCVWLYSPIEKSWTRIPCLNATQETAPGPRIGARLFAEGLTLYLYGGTTQDGRISSDLYRYSIPTREWVALPNPPALASPTNAALADGHLYLITSAEDGMSSQLHILALDNPTNTSHAKEMTAAEKEMKWTTLTFPTNPMAPGPRARHDGALIPISTGYGRNYLVYLLGTRDSPLPPASPSDEKTKAEEPPPPSQWSDTWTLQLPSSSVIQHPPSNHPTDPPSSNENTGTIDTLASKTPSLNPAHIKDALRTSVGASPGTFSWAQVEINIPEDPANPSYHPPSAFSKKVGEVVGAVKGAVAGRGDEKESDDNKDGEGKEVGARVESGKLHPGPRSAFGADVVRGGADGAGSPNSVVFWGGVDAGGRCVGDGWVVAFE